MSANLLFAMADPFTPILETFGYNKQIFFTHVVGFVVLAVCLRIWAFGPIMKMLDERKARIAQSMSDAEKTKQELASAKVKAQEILAQANAQATKLIEEGRAAAARVQEQETQKAIAAAEQIIIKAREAAAADHSRMLSDLRKEVGRLVVETTTKVTGKVLTGDDQKKLAEETSKQLAA